MKNHRGRSIFLVGFRSASTVVAGLLSEPPPSPSVGLSPIFRIASRSHALMPGSSGLRKILRRQAGKSVMPRFGY